MLHALESLELRRLLSNTGIISGSVYNDLNANAKHEAGEGGVKSVRLYLDANNNGKLDKRETSTVTDKRGQYRFENLAAGTHRLRQVVDSNTTIVSAPRSSWFRITLADGQHVARRQFANVSVTRVPGENDLPDHLITGLTEFNTDTLIKFTYYGDTDLNGVVNFDDYARTETSFNNDRTGWFNGDFDYNGVVNFDDYQLIDYAFTQPGAIVLNPPPAAPTPTPTPVQPTAKSVAKADFKRTHADHSLLSAKSYLLGNKDVIRSEGLYAVIEHWHQYGIEYKREFLRLARDY